MGSYYNKNIKTQVKISTFLLESQIYRPSREAAPPSSSGVALKFYHVPIYFFVKELDCELKFEYLVMGVQCGEVPRNIYYR